MKYILRIIVSLIVISILSIIHSIYGLPYMIMCGFAMLYVKDI